MAMNLLVNMRNALDNVPTPQLYGWIDSTAALHWIKGNGQYKQFVANQVAKINYINRFSGGTLHPAINQLISLAKAVQSSRRRFGKEGPIGFKPNRSWPENRVTQASPASEKKAN